MGRDVYCAVERRDASGRWRFAGALDVGRSYALFDVLAGAGGSTRRSPIAPARGLPADLDPESCTDDDRESCFGGADEFGKNFRSWLTLAELQSYDWVAFLGEHEVPGVHRNKRACARFIEWIQRQDAPADDLRIVFGFDR